MKVRTLNSTFHRLRQKTNQLITEAAVHIVTGRFVHFAGPFLNTNDARVFQEGFLPTAFDEEEAQEISPRKGLADKGYYSNNPMSKLYQCLYSMVRKNPGEEHLDPQVKKLNHLISSVRIEAERAFGRLRQLKRLVECFSAKGSMEEKLLKHSRLFKIAVHFTNYSFKFRPLRKSPHWTLCKGPLPTATVRARLQAYMAADPGTHLRDVLHPEDLRILDPLEPDQEDEE